MVDVFSRQTTCVEMNRYCDYVYLPNVMTPLSLLLMCFKLSVEFRTNRLACLCFLQEKFEDIKEVISSHISMGYRQYNGQEKTYKRSNNNVQNRKLKIEQHKSH